MARIIHYKKVASDTRKTPKSTLTFWRLFFQMSISNQEQKLVVNHLNWFTLFCLTLINSNFNTAISTAI